MEFHDRPLLSYADLSIILLKTARAAGTTLDHAAAAVGALLREADETAPDPGELREHLGRIAHDLAGAGLLAPAPGNSGTLHITQRGEAALADHPAGLDPSVLADFVGFRPALGAAHTAQPPAEATPRSYAQGYEAFRAGRSATDNPYAQDSADHLSWENGWSEARDERQAGTVA